MCADTVSFLQRNSQQLGTSKMSGTSAPMCKESFHNGYELLYRSVRHVPQCCRPHMPLGWRTQAVAVVYGQDLIASFLPPQRDDSRRRGICARADSLAMPPRPAQHDGFGSCNAQCSNLMVYCIARPGICEDGVVCPFGRQAKVSSDFTCN